MRGSDARSGSLFSYVDLESRVPVKHPLRVIKAIVDDVLASLDGDFERLYEGTGRQSIAPERLLRASLLQAFYSIRSERPADAADRLQPAVSLVCGARHRRRRVGPLDVLQTAAAASASSSRSTQATGTAEREAAIAMLEQHAPGERRLTLAADKAYDVRGFTADLRRMCVTPHIARNDTIDRHGRQRSSSIDGRTTRHPGYAVSQRARKRIEEAFMPRSAGCGGPAAATARREG